LEPSVAYDLWSSSYDAETDNLLVDLDDRIFDGLLQEVGVRGKVVVDVGCGTGRHWAKILAGNPARLLGFDASSGMLGKLLAKYPKAVVQKVTGYRLPALADESCDLVVSTLALGHIHNAAAALSEWSRVLKPGGDLIVTDLHPDAAARSECTFRHRGRLVAAQLHVHPLELLKSAFLANGLLVERLEERFVDESVRKHYEAVNAASEFERMNGVKLIYGFRLKKR
jgi:ubiquinone/menaquinone biosynthesis C-methylase UbiE